MQYSDWNREPYGPIDKSRLEKLIRSWDVPVEFLKWLSLVNGGKPNKTCIQISDTWGQSEFHHVYGLSAGPDFVQLDKANEHLSGNLPPKLLAFADDPGGNQFVISTRESDAGSILFWDHETNNLHRLAPTIQEFFKLLHENEQAQTPLEKILRNDDLEELKAWLCAHDIEERNEVGSTPIEEAAIYRSTKCIRHLHSIGAKLGDALKNAEDNLEFFPDHQATVDLLKILYH